MTTLRLSLIFGISEPQFVKLIAPVKRELFDSGIYSIVVDEQKYPRVILRRNANLSFGLLKYSSNLVV